ARERQLDGDVEPAARREELTDATAQLDARKPGAHACLQCGAGRGDPADRRADEPIGSVVVPELAANGKPAELRFAATASARQIDDIRLGCASEQHESEQRSGLHAAAS